MIYPLSNLEIADLYENHMRHDFPSGELKPLAKLEYLHLSGLYDVLVETLNNKILAYACIFHDEEKILLDYYAVTETMRGQGYGSRFLETILSGELFKKDLLVELEDPEEATSIEEAALRKRRIAFYERLGFVPTDVKANIFGIPYLIYVKGDGIVEVDQALASIYREFASTPEEYNKNVHIKKV